jgi:hypothetical protein
METTDNDKSLETCLLIILVTEGLPLIVIGIFLQSIAALMLGILMSIGGLLFVIYKIIRIIVSLKDKSKSKTTIIKKDINLFEDCCKD